MTVGKSVRIFLVDGTVGGLVTAEIMNWTGHLLAADRSQLSDLAGRPEARRTGVYFLMGTDDETGEDLLYIGEADDVGSRLKYHAGPTRPDGSGGKEFWNKAIAVTSKDSNLTKAHARYLESHLIAKATRAGQVRLLNGTAPPPISLPEADSSDMDEFIRQTEIVLPILGLHALRGAPPRRTRDQDSPQPDTSIEADGASPVFAIARSGGSVAASGQEIDGEFVVFEGSTARASWVGSPGGYGTLHQRLVENGVLGPLSDSDTRAFTRDYAFKSPSAAAAVIHGRNANGRTEWKEPTTGRTYADWQTSLLEPSGEASASVAEESNLT